MTIRVSALNRTSTSHSHVLGNITERGVEGMQELMSPNLHHRTPSCGLYISGACMNSQQQYFHTRLDIPTFHHWWGGPPKSNTSEELETVIGCDEGRLCHTQSVDTSKLLSLKEMPQQIKFQWQKETWKWDGDLLAKRSLMEGGEKKKRCMSSDEGWR